jgi:AraC-like DNA-binding protein
MNAHLHHTQNWDELAYEVNWSASKLAKKCGVSVRTLQRYFIKQLDKTPKAWLTKQRQYKAFDLLRGGKSVKETASQLGYQHQQHFSREFKAYWGCSPSTHASLAGKEAARRISV